MELLRTPDERFEELDGWPYEPRYVDVEGARAARTYAPRMHYVEDGAGAPILCLHGEPSWSYLYRKMIPILATRGRVVAPDFLGFGRSDKPARVEDHSVAFHVATLARFVEALDLRDVTLVCQDWGGLIGLPVVARMPARFARLVVMNTGLPDGSFPMPEAWLRFRDSVAKAPDLDVARMVAKGCAKPLSSEARAAYDAPFPSPEFKAGPRAFPLMMPLSSEDAGAAFMREAITCLSEWRKPAITLFSDEDPITRLGEAFFRIVVPSIANEPEITIAGAGHFLQEDAGEEVAREIVAFLDRHREGSKGLE